MQIFLYFFFLILFQDTIISEIMQQNDGKMTVFITLPPLFLQRAYNIFLHALLVFVLRYTVLLCARMAGRDMENGERNCGVCAYTDMLLGEGPSYM